MSAHDAGAGFKRLWPIVVLERAIPGCDAPNDALRELVLRLDLENRDLTTDYRGGNFLGRDEPAVHWLTQCVNVTVRDYFHHLGMDYDVRWRQHAWPNLNRFGDYHDVHNHPHAYLSGTYYVQVPADRGPSPTRRDLRPGCISLYDPRATTNMTAIRGDPYVEPEYTVQPYAGLMMLWPAFVSHFVHPNLSQQPRISISFNVMLEWSDDYLPRQ